MHWKTLNFTPKKKSWKILARFFVSWPLEKNVEFLLLQQQPRKKRSTQFNSIFPGCFALVEHNELELAWLSSFFLLPWKKVYLNARIFWKMAKLFTLTEKKLCPIPVWAYHNYLIYSMPTPRMEWEVERAWCRLILLFPFVSHSSPSPFACPRITHTHNLWNQQFFFNGHFKPAPGSRQKRSVIAQFAQFARANWTIIVIDFWSGTPLLSKGNSAIIHGLMLMANYDHN